MQQKAECAGAPGKSRRKMPKQAEVLTAAAANQRIISLFSLARKAGKLIAGADMVKEAVRAGRAGAVFTASDLSPKSQKEIEYVCRPLSVPVLPMEITMDEMASRVGRRSGILAVADTGFERKLRSLLEQAEQASSARSEGTAYPLP